MLRRLRSCIFLVTCVQFLLAQLNEKESKSEEMAVKAVQTVVKQLRKGGIKIKKDAVITVQNIVAAINLGGKIHLEQAARKLPRSMYEPEQFPGLIHRMLDPKTVILLFASGKLVCTGAKKEADVYRSVHNLHSTLEEANQNRLNVYNYLKSINVLILVVSHEYVIKFMAFHIYHSFCERIGVVFVRTYLSDGYNSSCLVIVNVMI